MSGSPFKPPDDPSAEPIHGAEPIHRPPPGGVPPITIRQRDEPGSGQAARRNRFQFSLRSLFLVVTGVSVLVSLTAWLGLAFLLVTMMLGGVITVFAGTFLLDNRVILAGGMLMFVASALSPVMFIMSEF